MVARDFDVEGKRVTVVGAARSGIAAAELLARRRARVTLTEMRPEVADAEPLRRLGVQIETFHPWIAVMLNFSADHLDRHPSVDAYGAAKARIFENQTADDWAVINADDPAVLDLARRGRAQQRLFARRAPIERGTAIEDGWIVDRRDWPFAPVGAVQTVRLVPLDAIHLLGAHLVSDVMAAATVGAIAGGAPAALTAAVESFQGLEHAMEFVADIDGVRFINDSKATNVEAALRSIESFDSGLVPIIGGRFKGGDLRLLREPLAARAKAVMAI